MDEQPQANQKAAILGAADRETIAVPVPEWSQTVRLRALSGRERDKWEAEYTAAKDGGKDQEKQNIRARCAVLSIVDDAGKRIFDDADADALGEKSAAALDRIFTAFMQLNKLSKKEAEELEKN